MIQWVAIKTVPVHRAEFRVATRINQCEFQTMVPYEIVYERRQGRREPKREKQALFSRYVFAGLQNVVADFDRLRKGVPHLGIPGIHEISGIVSRSRDEWSPLVLTAADVALIQRAVDSSAGITEVDLHKAFKPGKAIEVSMGGGIVQTTTIDSITKKGVRALLNMLGSMHVVEVSFDKVRAA